MNFGAAGIAAGMDDPVAIVATFEGSRQRTVVVAVETSAKGDQFGQALWTFLDQCADIARVAESCAGDLGVVGVVERVVVAVGSGDPALCPGCTPGTGTDNEYVPGRRQA